MFRFIAVVPLALGILTSGIRAEDKAFDDAEFVKKAASGGMTEVMMGQLGTKMGQSAGVKQFSETLIADHTKANRELMTVAKAAGLSVPEAISADDQKHVEMIKEHKGAEFDKAFVDHMVKDHEKDIAEFKRASTEAKDPNIKAFATKTLPTLQTHLEMAKKLQGGEK